MSQITENTLIIKNKHLDAVKDLIAKKGYDDTLKIIYSNSDWTLVIFDYNGTLDGSAEFFNIRFVEDYDYMMETNYLDGEELWIRNGYKDYEDSIAKQIKEGKFFKELLFNKNKQKEILKRIIYSC